jgi:hypothetical protein
MRALYQELAKKAKKRNPPKGIISGRAENLMKQLD